MIFKNIKILLFQVILQYHVYCRALKEQSLRILDKINNSNHNNNENSGESQDDYRQIVIIVAIVLILLCLFTILVRLRARRQKVRNLRKIPDKGHIVNIQIDYLNNEIQNGQIKKHRHKHHHKSAIIQDINFTDQYNQQQEINYPFKTYVQGIPIQNYQQSSNNKSIKLSPKSEVPAIATVVI